MKELHIKGIENGTAIDHIPQGKGIQVMHVLGMLEGFGNATVSFACNVESKKLVGRKDLIFIENKILSMQELGKIALIARNATVNEIAGHEVKSKKILELPEFVEGILSCPNSKCISSIEKLSGKFAISKSLEKAKCIYCETELNTEEIEKAIK